MWTITAEQSLAKSLAKNSAKWKRKLSFCCRQMLSITRKVKETSGIANVRIYLQDAVKRMKGFRIDNELPVLLLPFREVFKWLSKVITWLRLLRSVIGSKDSRQFFNQWEAKPTPIAPCTREFSRASSELQVIARNCDWFMALFVPVVIGQSNCFGFGFSTVIWKPLY